MLISSRITQQDRGKLLVDFLGEKFKYLSPDQWVERVNEGRFSIVEQICSVDTVLHTHDILTYDAPPFVEPDADLSYSIIMETNQFLAVNKPGNLLVHKKGAAVTHNLIYQLRENHTPPYPEADIVNRLDRETSGVVLVSKEKESLRILSDLFVDRKVEKEYHAITNGIPQMHEGIIPFPLLPDPSGSIRSRQIISDEGKIAETRYRVVETWGNRALIQLFPKTGRTHQLRVHLAGIGCPIVGDKLYGMPEANYLLWRKDPSQIQLEFPRHALHCSGVTFHFSGVDYSITAPFPKDFLSLLPKTDSDSIA